MEHLETSDPRIRREDSSGHVTLGSRPHADDIWSAVANRVFRFGGGGALSTFVGGGGGSGA